MTKKDYIYIGIILLLTTGYVIQDLMGTTETNKSKLLYDYYPKEKDIAKPYSEIYKKEIKDTKPKDEKTTPPILTKNYETEEKQPIKISIDSSKLVLIDTLSQEKYVISKEYLSLFPNNDKLISFILSKDTLGIVTLNTEGRFIDKTYPLYLEQFRYRFYDNELHHYPSKTKTKIDYKNKFNQLYINTGYNFINQSPNISLDYLINLGKFRIMAGSEVQLKTGEVIVNTKLGYRIF